MSSAAARAITIGPVCDATKQNEMSASPANAEALPKASTAALSTGVASESSRTSCAGSRANSSATRSYSCELVSPFKSPVARTIVVLVASRCAMHENDLPGCVSPSLLLTDVTSRVLSNESSRTQRVLISVERPGAVRIAPRRIPPVVSLPGGRSAAKQARFVHAAAHQCGGRRLPPIPRPPRRRRLR